MTVTINANGVFINDAQVIVADVLADNGVVHVIDAVLLPPPPPSNTVVDIIVNSADHTILETAVLAAGLEGALSGDGPFTVFAPTDAAFSALPPGTIDALLQDPQGLLTEILTYHVAAGNVLSTDLSDGQVITTLNGATVTVTINANGVFINDAQVIVADVLADNGVVHVIDAVLLPPSNTRQVGERFDVEIFPNPAASYLQVIPGRDALPIEQVQLVDQEGRLHRTWKNQDVFERLDVREVPNGAYFLRFLIEGQVYFHKVIVQH